MEKRILYLIPRFTTGGAEQLVFQYARFFQSRGYDVAVGSVVGGGEWAQKFANLGIKTHVAQGKKFSSWRELKKFVREFNPEIIHSHIFSGDLAGYLLTKKNKEITWISTQHNVEFGNSWFKRAIWRFILSSADSIVAVSENVRKYCEKTFKINAKKIKLIKNGIDLSIWLPIPAGEYKKDAVLQLATIGRLERQKGHIYLIKALAELKNENWHWHVYGAGSLTDKLKKITFKMGIQNRVTWHGVSDNLPTEFKDIDVVIQPSLWEGLSLVAMETMAAGRVLIGTPWVVTGLVENKESGLIVKQLM